MTFIERINLLIDEIGKTFKEIRQSIGEKGNLKTLNKTSLVAAINELSEKPSSSLVLDDGSMSSSSVYSSEKVESLISDTKGNIISQIIGEADEAYNTLKEVSDYISSDKSGAALMAEQIGKRLKIDEVQQLSQEQRTNVETTLNIGNTDTDFVTKFKEAMK